MQPSHAADKKNRKFMAVDNFFLQRKTYAPYGFNKCFIAVIRLSNAIIKRLQHFTLVT
jgi:hypothetical protein